jgi:hypothetical protein
MAAPGTFTMPHNCGEAEHAYKIEQRVIIGRANAYASCLAQDFARDDCSGKLEALTRQQKKYVTVVDDVRSRCSQ